MNLLNLLKKPKTHLIIFLLDGENSDTAVSESIEVFTSFDNAVKRRNLLANTFPYSVLRKSHPESEFAICTTDSYFGKKYLN